MPQPRLRTAVRKARERHAFWDRHGERFRLSLIGVGVVAVATTIAKLLLPLLG